MARRKQRWTPAEARLWYLVARDLVAACVGAFLFVYGALNAVQLGVILLGTVFFFGGVLLGIPVALLLARSGNNGGE